MVAGFGRDPVAPADQESAVEDVMLCGHGDNGFRWFTFLIPGLPALGLVPRVPGIHLSTNAGARGAMDPGDKHRDDTRDKC